jgi:hypothetical protein
VCVSCISFDTLQPLRLNVDGRQPNILSPFEEIPTLVSESEEFTKKVQQKAVQLSFQHGKQYVVMPYDAM